MNLTKLAIMQNVIFSMLQKTSRPTCMRKHEYKKDIQTRYDSIEANVNMHNPDIAFSLV